MLSLPFVSVTALSAKPRLIIMPLVGLLHLDIEVVHCTMLGDTVFRDQRVVLLRAKQGSGSALA